MARRRNGAAKRAVRAAGAAALVLGATAVGGAAGCLQILGDEGPFVLGTGGGGTGGAGASGGGTAGSGGAGVCTPDEPRSCYSGPTGTEGVGNCKAGTETCAADGQSWGPCEGEVQPQQEDPLAVGDEACDGYAPGEAIWSKLFGSTGAQRGYWVAASPVAGGIYITGTFNSAFNFGRTELMPSGQEDAFVGKLDANGEAVWAKPIPGVMPLTLPMVSATPDGGAIVTIRLEAQTDLGKGPLGPGIIVARVSSDGTVQWSKTCGGGPDTAFLWPTVSGSDVVLWGSFDQTLDCGTQPQTAIGPADLFLGKLDADTGQVKWTRRFGSGNDHDAGNVSVDAAGNIIATGRVSGAVSTNFGAGAVSDPDGVGSYVLKFDTDGNSQWVYKITGAGDQWANFLGLDPAGGATVSGTFDSEVVLPGGVTLTGDPANKNLFVLRVNAAGGNGWAKAFGATGTGLQPPSISVTSKGDAILAGTFFNGVLDLGGDQLVASAVVEGYMARLSSSDGSHVWSRTFGNVGLLAISAVTPQDEVVFTGTVDGQVNFGNGPLLSSASDIFVAKVAP